MLLFGAGALLLQAAAPGEWFLAGNRPSAYVFGLDDQARFDGQPSLSLRHREGAVAQGFGTAMLQFAADNYRGKKVQFTANVKAEGVANRSGLWMRVDEGRETVAFDNMQSRPIHGTAGWKSYAVVLHVPRGATKISLGILLGGPGAVWMNQPAFGIAGSSAPLPIVLARPQASAGAVQVTRLEEGLYHVALPANQRWGAWIPNPDGRPLNLYNLTGHICWDPNPQVQQGCNGPEGSSLIPAAGMAQPEDFLAADKPAGSLVTKSEGGKTYFSVNDRRDGFDDNHGSFSFDVKLGDKPTQ